jgi:hypothetical protein
MDRIYGSYIVWMVYCMGHILYGWYIVWAIYCKDGILYGPYIVWMVYCMDGILYYRDPHVVNQAWGCELPDAVTAFN